MTKRKKSAPVDPNPKPPDWTERVAETEGQRFAYGYVRVGDSQAVCAVVYDVTGLKPIKAAPPNPPGIAEAKAQVWMEMGEGRKWAKEMGGG